MGLSFELTLHAEEPSQGVTVMYLWLAQGYHNIFLQELHTQVVQLLPECSLYQEL